MAKYSFSLRTAPGVPSCNCEIKLGSPDLSCPHLILSSLWLRPILFYLLFYQMIRLLYFRIYLHLSVLRAQLPHLAKARASTPGPQAKKHVVESVKSVCFTPRKPQEPGRGSPPPPLLWLATLEEPQQRPDTLLPSPTAKGHSPVLHSPYSELTSILEARSSDCFLP